MSEPAPSSQTPASGMAAHRATYEAFLKFSMAGTIICLYILLALVAFRFMNNPGNVMLGFGALFLGVITSMVAMRLGGKWMIAVVPLVLLGLYVAGNVHLG